MFSGFYIYLSAILLYMSSLVYLLWNGNLFDNHKIMPLVTVEQNILQQSKCVGSIQNKALFCAHDLLIFKLRYIDFSSWELKFIHLYTVQTGDLSNSN